MDVVRLLGGLSVSCVMAAGAAGSPILSPTTVAGFESIRLGDADGFGFNVLGAEVIKSLSGASGNADRGGDEDRDGVSDGIQDGLLGPTDVLPDRYFPATSRKLNMVAGFTGDDFDNRSNESVNGHSFTDIGSTGQEYTDISLSKSYDVSSAAMEVYDANAKSFGSGGAFPHSPSGELPNQPGFIFDFTVKFEDLDEKAILTKGGSPELRPIFFNLVFGDYDVEPANIDLTYRKGDTLTKKPIEEPLRVQNNTPGTNGLNEDGLIQRAGLELAFNDVFEADTVNGVWRGYLGVDFAAVNEPYTAFDFVELSVKPGFVPPGTCPPNCPPIPTTPTLPLVALGLLLTGYARRLRPS